MIKVVRKLEHVIATNHTNKNGKREMVRSKPCGPQVDAERYYQQRLSELNGKVEREKMETAGERKYWPDAFVTFQSLASKYRAAQVVHVGKLQTYMVRLLKFCGFWQCKVTCKLAQNLA